MTLTDLGWNDYFAQAYEPYRIQGLSPARVSREHKHLYEVIGEQGELSAEVTGKLRHAATGRGDFPAVGDWLAVQVLPEERKAIIHAVLPRQSAFVRKEAGARTEEQVVAANVNIVFLVSGLDGEFNVRRIERYITLAWDSGATPVVVLNKADACPNVDACVEEAESAAMGAEVLVVSAATSQGVDALRQRLGSGRTGAFLGMSGVGKSSLVNCLLGEERQTTYAVREDDLRGRHTTTHRELILLPGGGLVVDTPGMRELQLWTTESGLERSFEDVEAFAAQCRFSDCRHESEPGCAVQDAIASGSLDSARWQSYLKLKRELHYLARRQDHASRLAEKEKWKKIHMEIRRMDKNK
ncbi:MAG: ribosome small subunit-dependent GTPase A [Candidatus Hydrogenedentes bacterium]|nr:ribosome small subunit-dependent GTPase A [Candidatus Hydrogenedentota bacterium]